MMTPGRASTGVPAEPTATQRRLDLIASLLGRRYPVEVDELLRMVPAYHAELERMEGAEPARAKRIHDSLRRKFERDKRELRALGIPLMTVRMTLASGEDGEGYRIPSASFYLPLLRVMRGGTDPGDRPAPRGARVIDLTEEEAATALLALRRILELPAFPFDREARTALRKLTFDLDPSLADGHAVRILERAGGADPGGQLPVLMDALLERKRVRFGYERPGAPAADPPGATEPGRQVEPWGLFFQWGGWYLLGHDARRDPPLRLYRVDRMTGATKNGKRPGTPDFDRDSGFRIEDWMDRSAWELGPVEAGIETIEVRFRAPLDRLAERNGWGEAAPGSPDTRVFQVRSRGPFLRWILSHAGQARIVGPAEVAEELAAMASKVLERHRAVPGDKGGSP
jgi:proteasome accessory factor B